MKEWKSFAGNGCPAWQPGHDSQPRPEEVSRTVAPVTTISQSAVADVIASVRKSEGEISKLRSARGGVRDHLQRFEDLRVAVGAVEGRRAGAEEERAVGRVQEQRHHVRPAQVAEDPGGAVELTEGAARRRRGRRGRRG